MRTVQQVETIYDRARAILRKLRPEIIDALGLAGSVEETVRAFARSHQTCTFELDAQALPSLPKSLSNRRLLHVAGSAVERDECPLLTARNSGTGRPGSVWCLQGRLRGHGLRSHSVDSQLVPLRSGHPDSPRELRTGLLACACITVAIHCIHEPFSNSAPHSRHARDKGQR
jgi:hypothetical protein